MKKNDFIALTVDQYNALNRLATVSKMDCWFYIRQQPDGSDVVWDLEDDEAMPLLKGIRQLIDGMVEEDFKALTPAEQFTIAKLLSDLPYKEE